MMLFHLHDIPFLDLHRYYLFSSYFSIKQVAILHPVCFYSRYVKNTEWNEHETYLADESPCPHGKQVYYSIPYFIISSSKYDTKSPCRNSCVAKWLPYISAPLARFYARLLAVARRDKPFQTLTLTISDPNPNHFRP